MKIVENAPGLPKEWKTVELQEVADIFDKQRVPLNEFERKKMQGSFPYCGANGVVDWVNDFIFDGEYVLLAEDGGYWGPRENSSYIMKGKFWVNNHAHILQAKKDKTTNYFLHLSLNYLDLMPLIGGDARGKLTQAITKKIAILLPSFEEQEQITTVMSTIQDSKEKTEHVINSLKELKKSMMKHLFTYGPVSFEEADSIKLKDTEIGQIPENWHFEELKKFTNIVMGQSPPGNTYNETGQGMPFLQGKAEFGSRSPTYIKSTTKPTKIGKKDSILFSVRAPVGDVNIADRDYCIGRGLAAISSKEGSSIYVYYLLTYFKSEIEKEGTGSTFKAINKNKLEGFKLPNPDKSTQEEIAFILSSIDAKIESEERKKASLEEFFNSMLRDFMTAKVRVKDLVV